MNVSEEAVEAAVPRITGFLDLGGVMLTNQAAAKLARHILEATAPHLMAEILEDCADTAETDELTTAAEVIYDLRRHAKDLRP